MHERRQDDVVTIQGQGSGRLAWLLEKFVQRVPGAVSAVLASDDGLRESVYGLDEIHRDRLPAIISGFASLAGGVGQVAGDPGGRMRQVIVEHDAALLFVQTAGPGGLLGVLAERDADAGLVGYEMAALVSQLPSHLSTPARTAP